MTHLLGYDPAEVATKADIAELGIDLRAGASNLESRLNVRLDAVDRRLDRLFVTLVAGLFVIVAAMAGVVFTTL